MLKMWKVASMCKVENKFSILTFIIQNYWLFVIMMAVSFLIL